jgi:hypothetical protein
MGFLHSARFAPWMGGNRACSMRRSVRTRLLRGSTRARRLGRLRLGGVVPSVLRVTCPRESIGARAGGTGEIYRQVGQVGSVVDVHSADGSSGYRCTAGGDGEIVKLALQGGAFSCDGVEAMSRTHPTSIGLGLPSAGECWARSESFWLASVSRLTTRCRCKPDFYIFRSRLVSPDKPSSCGDEPLLPVCALVRDDPGQRLRGAAAV